MKTSIIEKAREVVKSCVIKAEDGTPMVTPDGNKGYRALWTRDFSYMVQYAGDCLSRDLVKANLEYLFRGISEGGVVPDRVDGKGRPWYVAGAPPTPLGHYNLDNAQFLVSATYNYALRFDDKEYAIEKLEPLAKGLQTIPVSGKGLVLNELKKAKNLYPVPHSTYGFYDTVLLTDEVFFCSLLAWQAHKELAEIAGWAEKKNRATVLIQSARKIEKNIAILWNDASGIFNAATGVGKQPDVWGSALALTIDFPVSKQKKERIVEFFLKNYRKLVYRGQLRHQLEGKYWEKLLVSYPRGTYQNGGYWGTPLRWLVKTLSIGDRELALKTLREAGESFEEIGFCEWVNRKGRFALPKYGATAASFLAATDSSFGK